MISSAGVAEVARLGNRHLEAVSGSWTPFAVEHALRLTEVRPASGSPEVLQVHVLVPTHLAGFVLGKRGCRIQEMASNSGAQIWMTARDGPRDRRVVIIGTFKQCKTAQELVHEQLTTA